MNSILDLDRTKSRPRLNNPRALAAVFMGVTIFGLFAYFLSHLEKLVSKSPGLVFLFPLSGILMIAAILPLVMFISYQDDFKEVNPLHPKVYMMLVKKTYIAMKDNNWKVSAKDI
uniref:Uncharacterized protein n=1 Tax=Pyramimonas obovata TaxID=1411642 RepID=A0A7S0RKR1_9CHLO|mmetsp:Transcript_36773/g.80111  ORF Transcript_36773/g.80111 Transcript_36773/m.80111 type:complete len:115 (+) Transcript_36773:97-441(+)|eukprot:CAMPEP_0118927586 /NCGR_PEP_ID=MMETSP1169-20130426/5023_1 /TAXON_ID=36882 /ORGANISM="Pyramimonas obovata, Strain CCMP722" /LENGTH=114 /DNA_ID=CAMNT_0006869373 /DNA_START=102 /DNA_END=446 /DNA_ORIENTATION=-